MLSLPLTNHRSHHNPGFPPADGAFGKVNFRKDKISLEMAPSRSENTCSKGMISGAPVTSQLACKSWASRESGSSAYWYGVTVMVCDGVLHPRCHSSKRMRLVRR